jgi:hypothetical protein
MPHGVQMRLGVGTGSFPFCQPIKGTNGAQNLDRFAACRSLAHIPPGPDGFSSCLYCCVVRVFSLLTLPGTHTLLAFEGSIIEAHPSLTDILIGLIVISSLSPFYLWSSHYDIFKRGIGFVEGRSQECYASWHLYTCWSVIISRTPRRH